MSPERPAASAPHFAADRFERLRPPCGKSASGSLMNTPRADYHGPQSPGISAIRSMPDKEKPGARTCPLRVTNTMDRVRRSAALSQGRGHRATAADATPRTQGRQASPKKGDRGRLGHDDECPVGRERVDVRCVFAASKSSCASAAEQVGGTRVTDDDDAGTAVAA